MCIFQAFFSSLKGFNLLEGNVHLLALSSLPQLASIFCVQKMTAYFL